MHHQYLCIQVDRRYKQIPLLNQVYVLHIMFQIIVAIHPVALKLIQDQNDELHALAKLLPTQHLFNQLDQFFLSILIMENVHLLSKM